MSQSSGVSVLDGAVFLQGDWGSGGYDNVGFYSGGVAGAGTATLTGQIGVFGAPVSADLDGTLVTLYAYATVAEGAGIVLTSQDYSTMYVFLTSPFSAAQSYPLTYASGDPNLPCFVAGTDIATARGDIQVERLRLGDRVVTLGSGGFAEVTWLGWRQIECLGHPRCHDVWPVRIAAGAFAPSMPYRELSLSPDHALFLDGCLIPVRYLVNGATIRQDEVDSVTYWHVELPAHDVMLANGLPAESYLDTGNRMFMHPSMRGGRRMLGVMRRVIASEASASRRSAAALRGEYQK